MSTNHSWTGPCASCSYCTLVGGGGVVLGEGGARSNWGNRWAHWHRNQTGWTDGKFIYMAHFIPKGNGECFTDYTSKKKKRNKAKKKRQRDARNAHGI